MKKVWRIVLVGFLLAIAYNLLLYWAPVKRHAYYSNEERLEGYVFDKRDYKIVSVGSSLSGAFEGRGLFAKNYFNLYMPRTGACTGVEIIRRSGKIPQQLYVEINCINRGTDTALINDVFNSDTYSLKYYIPVLQQKSKLLTNVLDLGKKNSSNINKVKPPAPLFNNLLKKAQKEWLEYPDMEKFNREYARLTQSLDIFASKGCKVVFFETPIDSSIRNGKLISYQRNKVLQLIKQKGYGFIPSDTSRAYNTGDGIHLLQGDRDIYVKYFKQQVKNMQLKSDLQTNK